MLWLILVSVLAIGAAYVLGGWMDREAEKRSEAEAAAWRERVEEFALRSARGLADASLLPSHAVGAAGKLLAQYLIEEAGADESAPAGIKQH